MELENFHDLWEKECRNSKGTHFVASTPSRNLTNSKLSLEKPMRWKMKFPSFWGKFGSSALIFALLLCIVNFPGFFFWPRYVSFWPLGFLGFRRWFFGEFGFVYGISSLLVEFGKRRRIDRRVPVNFFDAQGGGTTSHPRIWLFQFSSVFPYIL